ncbi:MAG: radical SAM family heme chaperone HemW [Planctomycetes bacterium]|nr:radical SAM family heme chaperone HemW [Planctomycetota bacterium]
MLALYVHVPFCVRKCGYCDFNSYVVDDDGAHDRFLAALAAELQRCWPAGQAPRSVFLGGGTPSLLSPERLRRLLAILASAVDLRACPEVTIECNPESVTTEKAAIAREHGVNRASLGVQTFDPDRLRFLDRAHSAAGAEAAFGALRAGGFDNLSLDLMFGVPGETLDEWVADLERALALGPDHMSCYNLTFEPGTHLTHARARGEVDANDEEVDRAMFLHTRQRLAGAGFTAYEISNFAGRGGPCRHNDHYWLQGDYVGIGPGASSHRGGVRWTNLKPLEAWADAALAGPSAVATAETLRPRQRAGEALWLGIRRRAGVDLEAVEHRLGLPVREWFGAAIAEQVDRGLADCDGTTLRLSDAGLLLADRVGAAFLIDDAAA